jgi:hypothetical protein
MSQFAAYRDLQATPQKARKCLKSNVQSSVKEDAGIEHVVVSHQSRGLGRPALRGMTPEKRSRVNWFTSRKSVCDQKGTMSSHRVIDQVSLQLQMLRKKVIPDVVGYKVTCGATLMAAPQSTGSYNRQH